MSEEHFVQVVLVDEIEHWRELLDHARQELIEAERLGDPQIIAIFKEDIAHCIVRLRELLV